MRFFWHSKSTVRQMATELSTTPSTIRIGVAGDSGEDTYTRYLVDPKHDNPLAAPKEKAFDLRVPSGAEFLVQAFEHILPSLVQSSAKTRYRIECIRSLTTSQSTARTMRRELRFLEAYRRDKDSILRLSHVIPFQSSPDDLGGSEVAAILRPQDTEYPDYLVAQDCTDNWRRSPAAAKFLRSFFSSPRKYPSPMPRLILNLGTYLPQHAGDSERSPVWNTLIDNADSVLALCSVRSLRISGAVITRRLSWEQSIADTLADLQEFPVLRQLSNFKHLIIRFGHVAALHIYRTQAAHSSSSEPKADFTFCPDISNGLPDSDRNGTIVGQNTAIAACLLQRIAAIDSENRALMSSRQSLGGLHPFHDSIVNGLRLGCSMYASGFPCPSQVGNATHFLDTFFGGALKHFAAKADLPSFCTIPLQLAVNRDRADNHWTILRTQLKQPQLSEINVGMAICLFGHSQVLNRDFGPDTSSQRTDPSGFTPGQMDEQTSRSSDTGADQPRGKTGATKVLDLVRDVLSQADYTFPANSSIPVPPTVRTYEPSPLYVPIMQFGALALIERQEIEAFRAIQNLMQHYAEQGTEKPLSVAIFGPPGSGKSFAVRELAASINGRLGPNIKRLEMIECNIAQLRDPSDLSIAIDRIASANAEHCLPLVFFDEFDAPMGEGKPLGWLKTFLAPMQDGKFYKDGSTISFGRAIFVFAGGLNRSLADFDPTSALPHNQRRSDDKPELLKRQAAFVDQKGPDFVSRLRGHINLLSLNADEAGSARDSQLAVPLLRRAMTLRGLLLKKKFVTRQFDCDIANIDRDVLYALLKVPRYKHGTRSMEAVVDMCMEVEGTIAKASLPSRAQLNMHVDAEDFIELMLEGRFRGIAAVSPNVRHPQ